MMSEVLLHKESLVHTVDQMEHLADKTGPAVSVKTFVLFDTETTGLRRYGHKPRITELCFIAVTREELLRKQKTPRVLNKLVICFNPRNEIGFEASRLTGLCNDALEDMADFSKQAPLITMFLRNLPQPVCLIAHNGNRFDFPLLVSHLKCGGGEIPEDVLCTDSLEALRTFDSSPAVPEFLLKKRQAGSSSAVTLTADTQCINSLKESSETSGDKLKLNKTKSIESNETNNIKTHQSCNNTSDNLKRTAETLETSYMNSKHAKVSPSHVVWDKTERTRSVSQMTKILGPESMNYSNSKKRNREVKQYLFREDSGSGIETNQGLVMYPDLVNSRRLETTLKCVSEMAANSPVVTQNHSSLGTRVNNKHRSRKQSYSLQNVYVRMFQKQPSKGHTAEGDCLALLKILNRKKAEFVSWCDSFAVPLMNISPMYR